MSNRRPTLHAAACAILGSMVVACGSPTAPAEELMVVRVARGFYSGLVNPQRLVIRSQAQLEEVWTATFRTQSHPPAVPVVDFAEELVILAAMGARGTSGFCISVESAAATGGVVTVTVLSISPPGGSVVLPVITSPFEIVRIPRRAETVTFIDESRAGHCSA